MDIAGLDVQNNGLTTTIFTGINMSEIKDKLYFFFYDEVGFSHIQFWKEVTMEELDSINDQYGTIQAAACEDTDENGLFWIVTDTDLKRMRDEINKELKN